MNRVRLWLRDPRYNRVVQIVLTIMIVLLGLELVLLAGCEGCCPTPSTCPSCNVSEVNVEQSKPRP